MKEKQSATRGLETVERTPAAAVRPSLHAPSSVALGGAEPLAEQLHHSPRMAAQRKQSGVTQRRVGAWANAVCAGGTIVYHNTGQDATVSLVTDGVRQVANAWGGGILGAGFYTHTTPGGAEVYGAQRYTLRFRVTGDVNGQVVPRGVIGHGIDTYAYAQGEDYVTGNTFLTNEDDRNEYKFHDGGSLAFVGVLDNTTGIDYVDAGAFINAVLA